MSEDQEKMEEEVEEVTVLILAGIKLIFFLVAGAALCF